MRLLESNELTNRWNPDFSSWFTMAGISILILIAGMWLSTYIETTRHVEEIIRLEQLYSQPLKP